MRVFIMDVILNDEVKNLDRLIGTEGEILRPSPQDDIKRPSRAEETKES